jgi:Mg2+-importing ATPase
MSERDESYWSVALAALSAQLGSAADGLSDAEAAARLARDGPNSLSSSRERGALRSFLQQFRSPLSWLLIFAVVVSSFAREWTDAVVIVAILLLGAILGFAHERRASSAVAALRARVALKATVVRAGRALSVDTSDVVVGDVVALAAGSMIPADGVLISSKDLLVSESVLTGESYPVEKSPGISAADAPLSARSNAVFAGTSVRSGSARMLVARVAKQTEFGRVAERLALDTPETDFDRGLRQFGALLTRVMFVLVLATTTANVLGHKPAVESLLFAIALAVGLAPEMLPAVVAVNLSRGAKAMADRGVIVRKLSAIEDFGAMNVLCTDKTGTLTEGRVTVERATDAAGVPSAAVLELAFLNAKLQSATGSPLDEAIVERCELLSMSPDRWRARDEVAFDFSRKRLSVVIERDDALTIVTKGALAQVLSVCSHVRGAEGLALTLTDGERARLLALLEEHGARGTRVLGVGSRSIVSKPAYDKRDERELVFEGLIELRDAPKAGARDAVEQLASLGVSIKMISGDARAVAVHVAREVGLSVERVMTGAELSSLQDEALWHAAERTSVFAEVDPNQKERVILALRKMGHVVGYMGDGINDAPALHAADVGISVEGATDVARDAAEFVLLERDLRVLRDGVLEGRRTFANTLKYIQTTESANFGNMLSMAVAAAFLPFLPLLAAQVLLNNFLSDIPAMAIASDAVDEEQLARPMRWDIAAIRRFMLVFGVVSSVFDLLTFALLYAVVHASPAMFRTGWFVESLLTEVAVALVVRTWRPFYKSRPGRWLLRLSAAVAFVAVALPYTPIGAWVGLVPLPLPLLALLVLVTAAYVFAVEVTKRALLARRPR